MVGRSHPETVAGFWIPPELHWVILSGFYKQEKKKNDGKQKKKNKLKSNYLDKGYPSIYHKQQKSTPIRGVQ